MDALENILILVMAAMDVESLQAEAMASIDKLSTPERRWIREELEAEGYKTMPRNLFYNYSTQEWV